ncbi:uncharacterized protein LOC132096945 [Carassius carassius]|uniref:uncharacterized protein LOC132096945 n=1 Tax=Carassius carassius TaxID=217509 RepID=UPI0028683D69|nr:uncharacterized protein LOC132096945 [Carassius carassius]
MNETLIAAGTITLKLHDLVFDRDGTGVSNGALNRCLCDVCIFQSGSGSPVSHRSSGLRLGLPPPSSSSSSHADMDSKRGGADQSSTGRTRRESGGKTEDVLRRDGTKEKSTSPAGVSPRSTEGNGLSSSPVLRKNPSREGSSSPRSQPRSPLCRSPTREKVRSPSPPASHESLSPGSPAPLSSSARGPSPALKH